MKTCEHQNFAATVDVHRLEDVKPMAFFAEIRIKCADCGLPFIFPGIPAGLDSQKAMCSPDAQKLSVPIQPKDSRIFPAVPGFTVRAQ